MNKILIIILFHGILTNHSYAECKFENWRDFKGTQLKREKDSGAYTYVTKHKSIDADGAPNAYHPDDVGKHCRTDKHIGLDCPANAGWSNDPKSWWSSVLVADPNDPTRPFIQKEGDFKGFYIAKTWLTNPSISSDTNIKKWVDSTSVPYVVMPGNEFPAIKGTGWKGDVGVAWNLENNKKVSFIIADRGGGNDAKLGEASLAFFNAMGMLNPNPRTGGGLNNDRIRFLVFPTTRKAGLKIWPRSSSDLDNQVDIMLWNLNQNGVVDSCDWLNYSEN